MRRIVLLLLFSSTLYTEEITYPFQPWYTGSLIAPTPITIPVGQGNLQPYLTYTVNNGQYDNDHHFVNTPNEQIWQLFSLLQFGILPKVDVEITPTAYYSKKQGASSITFGDLPIQIGVKLSEDHQSSWTFRSKFVIIEQFPTGKYQNLDPGNNGTDSSGSGAYRTSFGWFSEKTVFWWPAHPIRWRWTFQYSINTSVSVRGKNTYGGASDTVGKIHPGNTFQGVFAGEFSITQNWVAAFDLVYLWNGKTTFQGTQGIKVDGTLADIGSPTSYQWSFAPAFEYNFNSLIGVIGGAWFTFAGKNTTSFYGAQFSINYGFPAESPSPQTATVLK